MIAVWIMLVACNEKFVEINDAPEILNLAVTPDTITTSSELRCMATATDVNNDALQTVYRWDSSGTTLGDASVLQLTPDMVAPTQEIDCIVQISDGEDSIEQALTVTVTNSEPVLEDVRITPERAFVDSELECSFTASDPDLEVLSHEIVWTLAGEVLSNSETLILDPSTMNLNVGEEVVCSVEVEDAYGGSATMQSAVVLDNTQPNIDSVSLFPENPTTQDILTCTPQNPFDINNDVVEFSYQWTIDGVEQTVNGPELSGLGVGEVVECFVTPNDGVLDGETESASVTVINTAPVISAVVIQPNANVKADDSVVCSVTAEDMDGDVLTNTHQWSISSTSIVLGAQSNLQLSPIDVAVGDQVVCTVEVLDSHGAMVEDAASIVIENTEPVFTSPPLITGVATSGSTLTCQGTVEDLNDGTLSTTVSWMLSDGTVLGTGATLLIDPTATNAEDDIVCTIVATDNNGATVSQDTSTVVVNTAPVVNALSFVETAVFTNDELELSMSILDADQDQSITSTVEWHVLDNSNGMQDTVVQTGVDTILDGQYFDWSDEVYAVVTPFDGLDYGLSETSSSVTVLNTIPVIADLSLSDVTVFTNDQIEVVVTLEDEDVDDVEQVLSWIAEWHRVDGTTSQDTVVQTGSETIVDGQFFDKGDEVYAVVTPFDGTDYGVAVTSLTVAVLNTPPESIEVSVSPENPRLDLDDVECMVVNASPDVDGDTIQYTYEWSDSSGQILQNTQTIQTTDVLASSLLSIPEDITCTVTPFDGEDVAASTEASVSVVFDCNCPQTTDRDFAYTYWPLNFRHTNFNLYGFHTVRYFMTGYYGAVIDMSNGSLLNLVQVSGLNMEDVALSDDAWMESGLSSDITYSVEVNGVEWNATDFLNSGETGNHGEDNPSMLMDMGRFQQHMEIPEVLYQGNTDLLGSLSIVSTPQHLVLTHRTVSSTTYNGSVTIQTSLSGDLWTQSQLSVLDGTRAVQLLDTDGVGWIVIAPESSDVITQSSNGSVVVSRTVSSLTAGQEITIPVMLIPADEVSSSQIAMYLEPENTVQVNYAQMNQSDALTTGIQNAYWNWERGSFTVPLGSIMGSGASGNSTNWSNGTDFNLYNRHQLEIVHSSPESLYVPLFLDGPINTTFNITGGAPLFRSDNEEPTGLPIQVSKNWHVPGYWPNWFHMYSTPTVPAGSHSMELTVAIGKWGETFAASHAQLSLVGWGANQQWDESALGAWGESITYDPDKTLRRAMLDDVRPFLMEVNGQYNWTGNVGGADFLKYVDINRPWRDQQPTQLKSTYTAPGPVMTDVTYSGITDGGDIAMSAQTHLVRTDDLVRAYYVLQYDFLEDVEYARLGLFQIAADNYSDNGFTKYAYGDSTGVLFDATVPNHNTSGYASNADRGIALTGEHPWVFMYDSVRTGGNLPEHVADVGFVVREYAANINGVLIDTPHININRTRNGGWSQMAFELGVPFDAANVVIEAGSSIHAVVEYLVVPNDISLYYGPSTDMASVDPLLFGTTDIIELLASENSIEITPSIGVVEQVQPTVITGVVGEVAAQFEMIGGFGYTPMTIQGLFRADGWQLQYLDNGVWMTIDQSVHDNDFWQTRFDEDTGFYAVTFSVATDTATEFRLVR